MKNFLKEIRSTMSELFNENMSSLSSLIKDINLEDVNNRIKEVSNELQGELKKLKSKIKNGMMFFQVEVPFDISKSTISFKVEESSLKVTTETLNESKRSEITIIEIPSDVDINTLAQRYDEKRKVMVFFFKKKSYKDVIIFSDEDDNVNEEKKEEAEKAEAVSEEKASTKEQMVERMVRMHNEGISYKKIAEECGISERTVRRWIKTASLS